MIFYFLYRLGHILALAVPRRCAYGLARFVANCYWAFSRKDRRNIVNNLKVVLGEAPAEDYDILTKEVFGNFARYLVDFFRTEKVDGRFISEQVVVQGEEHLRRAREAGKGCILVSAHIGNWELGGLLVAFLGYPVHEVALTHQNKGINDFFLRQRAFGKIRVIPPGPSLRRCFTALKRGEFIALLGDRDFTENGIRTEFLGKSAKMPSGPAFFSYRTGAPIVPAFCFYADDGRINFVLEDPIVPSGRGSQEEQVRQLLSAYVSVIGRYVRRYPTQWYMFREVWNERPNGGPYTVI